MSNASVNCRSLKQRHDLSKFQLVLRQKCQKQMRERRNQLFNKGRSGLLPAKDVQETLTEIVRQEFNRLTTTTTDKTPCAMTISNEPLSQDEALREEREIIAEQEQWLMLEYERLMRCEEAMFDMLDNETICPMCQKSFLEEIPDFIVCHYCGLKLKTEISLDEFKNDLHIFVNAHTTDCTEVPEFSLLFDHNNASLCMSCSTCSCNFLIKTVKSQ